MILPSKLPNQDILLFEGLNLKILTKAKTNISVLEN
jgi:hypothetical protein